MSRSGASLKFASTTAPGNATTLFMLPLTVAELNICKAIIFVWQRQQGLGQDLQNKASLQAVPCQGKICSAICGNPLRLQINTHRGQVKPRRCRGWNFTCRSCATTLSSPLSVLFMDPVTPTMSPISIRVFRCLLNQHLLFDCLVSSSRASIQQFADYSLPCE